MRLAFQTILALLFALSTVSTARLQPTIRRHVHAVNKRDQTTCEDPKGAQQGGERHNGVNGETPVTGGRQAKHSHPAQGSGGSSTGKDNKGTSVDKFGDWTEPPNTVSPLGHPSAAQMGGLLSANTKHPGFLIGTAVHSDYLRQKVYTDCINKHFNMLVPEWEFKSDPIQIVPNHDNFAPVDLIVDYTQKNNMVFRGHVFWFDQTMAPWIRSLKGQKEAMQKAIRDHIFTMMGRYCKFMFEVDVMNELMAYDGYGGLKKDDFSGTLGPDFIQWTFGVFEEAKKEYGCHTIGAWNDNDVESAHIKRLTNKLGGMLKILKAERARGTPIRAVGLECHFDLGRVPHDFGDVIKAFIDEGVSVLLSELDVSNPQGEAGVAQQAKDYATVFKTCLDFYPHCLGVNVWSLDDAVTWRQGQNAAMFGPGCTDKGVHQAVMKVLSGN